MKRSPGRLICRVLGHKWAYLMGADARVSRLCLRCGDTEWQRR